ncbi:hypothetical protein CLOP_g3874 [Closterium sp. NIES-67]|nr:hypothetical protein CLOP_g3874 [Closterium sp. NIES-67]
MHRSGTFPVATLDGDGDLSPSRDFPRDFPRSHSSTSSGFPAALRGAYDALDFDDPHRLASTPPASVPRPRHHSPRHHHPHQQQHGTSATRHVSYQPGPTSSLRPHSHALRDDGGGGAARMAQGAQHQRGYTFAAAPILSPHRPGSGDSGLGGPLGDFFTDGGGEGARGGLGGHAQGAGRNLGHLRAGSMAIDADRGGLGEGGRRQEGRGRLGGGLGVGVSFEGGARGVQGSLSGGLGGGPGMGMGGSRSGGGARVWARTLSHQAADLSSTGGGGGRHLLGGDWLGLDRTSSGFDDGDMVATNAMLPRVNSLAVNGSRFLDSDDLLDGRQGRDGAGLGGAWEMDIGMEGGLGLGREYGRENGGVGGAMGGDGSQLKRVLRLVEAAHGNDADLVHAILQDAPSRTALLSSLHPDLRRAIA